MTRKFTYAVLALLMLAACQKTDTAKSSDDLPIRTPDALIISAKNFFINDIVTTQSSLASLNNEGFRRHQVSKTPLWEKAYIKHDDTKGDVVVVPLQYEKPLHFKTNFGNGATLSMEKQSDLWIYKDVYGKNKAEVRIALPDKIYQNGFVKSFEGYILEEDWFGNSLNRYLYKNGEVHILKKSLQSLDVSNTTNKDIVECDAIDWYECDDIDEFGNGTGCTYLYTEYVNCEGGGGDDGGGDNGGGGGGGQVNTLMFEFYDEKDELQYGEEDEDNNQQYVRIKYQYHATIVRDVNTREIVNVLIYNTTATPMVANYIDKYNRTVTRSLTVFNHVNGWTLLTPTTAKVNWSCSVNMRYTYANGSPTWTSQRIDRHSAVQ